MVAAARSAPCADRLGDGGRLLRLRRTVLLMWLLQATRMNSMDAMDLGNCGDALAAGGDIDRIEAALEAEQVVFDQAL